MSGLLVLGTDTGCGKTVVSCLLLAAARARGMRVAAFKPVETGCAPDPLDALALRAAAASDDPLEHVCPYRYALPAAPEAAAERPIDPASIRSAFDRLAGSGRFVLTEAAGGAGTPYGPDLLGLDLPRLLDLPVLLVARAVLGTIGQTLVALRSIEAAGGEVRGVVLCRVPGLETGPEDPTNAPLIGAHSGGVPVLGTLPLLDDGAPHPSDGPAFLRWAERNAPIIEEKAKIDLLLR